MRKEISVLWKLFFSFVLFIAPYILRAEDIMGTAFLQGQEEGRNKQKGPTVITADTMDMDMKNNLITLVGNVAVDDPNNKLTADKMLVYLQETKGANAKKELKAIVALGNVIMARKAITEEDKKMGKREARSGRADYDAIKGIIIMTENPILYQGDSYMNGERIILWKNTNRMKVEGERSSGRSRIVINQGTDTSLKTDTEKTGILLM